MSGGVPYFSVPRHVQIQRAHAKEHLTGEALEEALAATHYADEPPVGIVVGVRWHTFRENVRYTVARIREQRASDGQFEELYTNDLRALLRSRPRYEGGSR